MERTGAFAFSCLMLAACAAGVSLPVSGDGARWIAREYRPAGSGPFPAVVMLHGCSGMWQRDGTTPSGLYRSWGEHFRAAGYLAVAVDSFGPRGVQEVCTRSPSPVTPGRERAADAFAVLSELAARKDVDASHIYLIGWSHGGSTVLNVVRSDRQPRAGEPRFRAAVAMYPGCRALGRQPYATWMPLLIQSGAADDWTPAADCVDLARASSSRIEIDVYPAAGHAFDAPDLPSRYRPDVRNASSPTGFGATVGTNEPARAQAIARVSAFLAAH